MEERDGDVARRWMWMWMWIEWAEGMWGCDDVTG